MKIFNIKKIINFLKQNNLDILMCIFMVIFTITIFNVSNKTYKLKYAIASIDREVSLHPYDSFFGKSFVTDTYPIFKDVVFIGDSYAHNISLNLGFDMTNYSCPGFLVSELNHVMEVASKSNKEYAVIFIGPNDFGRRTELKDFHDTLDTYIKELKNAKFETIILSTYLHSRFTATFEEQKANKYSVDEYNNELLKLIDEENGIYYFDISDMDKHLDKYQNDPEDNIHFNFDFAVDYINRLYKLLIDIQKKKIYKIYG